MDEITLRVTQALDAVDAAYETIECDPALADTAQFCAHYGYPLAQSANAILVASKRPEGRHAVCVVLATDRLDVNGTVRRRLGVRKVSFADAAVTEAVTGMLIGGVTPFGLPASVPVWVDAAIRECAWVIVGGGSRSFKLKVTPGVFEATGAVFVDGLAKAPTWGAPAGGADP